MMYEIDWNEARRYAGMRGYAGPRLEQALHEAGELLTAAAVPRAVWLEVPLSIDEDTVRLGGMTVKSLSLAGHLAGCAGAVLIAATLGPEADRLIRRTCVTDICLAVLMDGCAASLLERRCDEWCAGIAAEHPGHALRPRFSPGYGDLPIGCQPELLALLDAPKRIGLTATGSNMLAPLKSVTAVAGFAPEGEHTEPCCEAACRKEDCAFRRMKGEAKKCF